MYNHRVELENVEIITGSELEMLRATCGHIAQNGYRYHQSIEKTAIFRSNNTHDLIDAIQNQYWDHSLQLLKIEDGWTVYIIINKDAVGKNNGVDIALKATAKSPMYKVSGNVSSWTSSLTSDSDALLDLALEAEQVS